MRLNFSRRGISASFSLRGIGGGGSPGCFFTVLLVMVAIIVVAMLRFPSEPPTESSSKPSASVSAKPLQKTKR